LEWIGFSSYKKSTALSKQQETTQEKASVWQKSRNSSLKTHRAALFWKCQFCEILGSPCRALSALSSQDSACNLKLLRRLQDQATKKYPPLLALAHTRHDDAADIKEW